MKDTQKDQFIENVTGIIIGGDDKLADVELFCGNRSQAKTQIEYEYASEIPKLAAEWGKSEKAKLYARYAGYEHLVPCRWREEKWTVRWRP